MVFGFLRGGKIQVHVEWPQDQVYRPGDTIPVRVHLRLQGRPRIREVRVGLVFWQRFQYPEWEEHDDGSIDYITIWKEKESWVAQAHLPLPDPLPANFQKTYEGTLTLHPDVPPPHEGRICQARWYLKAVVDRPWRPDVTYQGALRLVVPPPGAFQNLDFYGQATHPEEVDMRFRLPGLEFVEGDILEGALHLKARQPIKGRSLRIVLSVREFIRYRGITMPGLTFSDYEHEIPDMEYHARVADMTLAQPFQMQAGEERAFPFRIQLPRLGKPTCQACGEGGTIRWTLQGLVDRPWKRDYRVEQEIYMYNGR